MRDVNSVYFVGQFRVSLYTSSIHGIQYQNIFAILNLIQVVTFQSSKSSYWDILRKDTVLCPGSLSVRLEELFASVLRVDNRKSALPKHNQPSARDKKWHYKTENHGVIIAVVVTLEKWK